MAERKPMPTPVIRDGDPLMGQRFLQSLNALFSTARIHLDNNRLLQNCVATFSQILEELLQLDDEINLIASVGCFYLQQEKVNLERNAQALGRKMLTYFEERKIEGLRFNRSAAYVSADDFLVFIRLLNDAADKKDPLYWLQTKLEVKNFTWVEIIDTTRAQSLAAIFTSDQAGAPTGDKGRQTEAAPAPAGPQKTESTRQPKSRQLSRQPGKTGRKKGLSAKKRRKQRRTQKAVLTYSYAMHSLQDVAARLATNKNAGLGKSVQLVQNMVDLIMNDDNVLLDLSTIRDYDDYTFTHSINVSILALCLGHRIGLSKVALSRLGLSALFHDLGKIDIPKEVLNKPGKLDPQEYEVIKQHSLNSVRRILRLRASFDRKAGIMLPPFEHHLRYDLSGYPKTPRKKPISLFGRIITIADVYDAVTAPRIYRNTYLSPDKALGFMLKDSGKVFDPILLKVFINMLGVYPIGTVLVFENKEMGMVSHAPDETMEPSSLWALLLEKQGNGKFKKGAYINLGTWNPETGSFNRKVAETLHPADLGIQPAEYLL